MAKVDQGGGAETEGTSHAFWYDGHDQNTKREIALGIYGKWRGQENIKGVK